MSAQVSNQTFQACVVQIPPKFFIKHENWLGSTMLEWIMCVHVAPLKTTPCDLSIYHKTLCHTTTQAPQIHSATHTHHTHLHSFRSNISLSKCPQPRPEKAKRFVIPLSYLDQPSFQELFKSNLGRIWI